ncbi:RNA polymerase sigma factor FliA [Halomonadaceae bacterium KBTZ08]
MTQSGPLELYTQTHRADVDALVETHMPLVKKIALHLMARLPDHIQLEDLMQAGMVGLLEAARKYESGQGASFETYAGIRIRGAIVDEIRRGDWVPRSVHRNARRISEAIRTIEAREGRDARDAEVAQELGLSLADYHSRASDATTGRLFSLDELTDRNEHINDQAPSEGPEGELQEADFRSALATEIDQLPERERLVLSLYYQDELNLKEIGAVLEVSESRVSQIHGQAAARLRARMRERLGG